MPSDSFCWLLFSSCSCAGMCFLFSFRRKVVRHHQILPVGGTGSSASNQGSFARPFGDGSSPSLRAYVVVRDGRRRKIRRTEFRGSKGKRFPNRATNQQTLP